ncbi:MAG TPA: SDR family NAD(P)-dependent oxidoreductase [Nakamurella sp.]
MSLQGKVAIVTGSGRGLGLAYAQELAAQGAAVIINDVDESVAQEAVALIQAAGGRAAAVVAPVGPTQTAQKLVSTAVARFGRLDILVTNAGVLRDKSLLKMSDDDFDLVVNVHLRGTFTCVREAYAYFKATRSPAGSSRSARRPGSAATSGRPTTPPPRPASWAWSAPGRWRCASPGCA